MMEVEYRDFQENIEKFTEIGMKITVHVIKDGKHILDLKPIEKEDTRITALNNFAGAVKDATKTAEEYKEERLMRH